MEVGGSSRELVILRESNLPRHEGDGVSVGVRGVAQPSDREVVAARTLWSRGWTPLYILLLRGRAGFAADD